MVVWIIIGILLIVLGLLLFSPLELDIDSEKSKYEVRWKGIGGAAFDLKDGLPVIRFHVFFFRKELSLFNIKPQEASRKKEIPIKKKKKRSFRWMTRKARLLIRSFRIKELKINLDTDDYILNAYLFPIFFFLKKNNRDLQINFKGDFEVRLLVINRPVWLLAAFLR